MHQIGGRLVALGRLDRRVAFGDPTNSRSARVRVFPFGRGLACRVPTAARAIRTEETIDATNT